MELLLILSILYALVRLQSKVMPGRSPGDRPKTQVPSNRTIALFALGLGSVTFLVGIWAPFGWWWEPLHLEPAHFPQYIALFTDGIIAYRNNWFTDITTSQASFWGWVPLALVPLLPALAVAAGAPSGDFNPAVTGGFTWLSLAYSLWEAFIGVALVVTVLVWFRNRFVRQSKLLREMSAAPYAVYAPHPLVIGYHLMVIYTPPT